MKRLVILKLLLKKAFFFSFPFSVCIAKHHCLLRFLKKSMGTQLCILFLSAF